MTDGQAYVYLKHIWKTGTHAQRAAIVRASFNIVITSSGTKTPEAVADWSWEELTDDLKGDLTSSLV